jgi:hypothetical protein
MHRVQLLNVGRVGSTVERVQHADQTGVLGQALAYPGHRCHHGRVGLDAHRLGDVHRRQRRTDHQAGGRAPVGERPRGRERGLGRTSPGLASAAPSAQAARVDGDPHPQLVAP